MAIGEVERLNRLVFLGTGTSQGADHRMLLRGVPL